MACATGKESLPVERKARLDALGLVWDPYVAQWEEGFGHLQAFVAEYGHCRVPRKHVTADGYRLGGWVGVQRREQDSMTAQRKARLDALGFEWDASKRRPAAE
jgi:Helicase associated domain